MKSITLIVSFLFLLALSGFSQENIALDSTETLKPEEVWGYWQNVSKNFRYGTNHLFPKKFSKKIGSLEDDKISLPIQQSAPGPEYIDVNRAGFFTDPRYPNAKWILNGNYLYVKPLLGQPFRIFIYRNDSTHEYSFLFHGEKFISVTHRHEKSDCE